MAMTSEFEQFITEKFIKAHFKATGIKVIPHIYPFKWLGCTDDEFMSEKLNYSHGPAIPEDKKVSLLGVVRQQETELRARRDHVKKRETVMGSFPKQVQLELW